jgi:HK97 family phage major capsid protein
LPYNSVTGRTDAAPLIPEDVQRQIVEDTVQQSAALQLFENVPMSTKTTRLPILSALPVAYFVNGDTGLKQTTKMAWENKYLNVEEIATIVPIPESVLDDSEFDMWAAITPKITAAVGRALDAAIFFGVDKPGTWPAAIVTDAVAKGNFYDLVTSPTPAAEGGLAEDINQLMGIVEADGYEASGFIARSGMRVRLRGARDSTGQKLVDVSNNTVEGAQIQYVMNGLWPVQASGIRGVDIVTGDFSQGLLGVRQDIEVKFLDQAVIQDATGAIQLNLAQQDAVAMRVKARYAFQIANPINWENTSSATRYPFAAGGTPAGA